MVAAALALAQTVDAAAAAAHLALAELKVHELMLMAAVPLEWAAAHFQFQCGAAQLDAAPAAVPSSPPMLPLPTPLRLRLERPDM